VVPEMMEKMLVFVKLFIEHSENFIADQLHGWGFEIRNAPPPANWRPPLAIEGADL
jgi:hypothetical protein